MVFRDMAKSQQEREEELARRTGAIILAWSHAEWHLMLLISAFLGCDLNRGRIVWASATSFRAKRELLARLGETFLVDALLPEFRSITAKVKHLSEKRNLIAHDRGYHLKGNTFRFMNDQNPTQPQTFGRYRDVQISNLKTWEKEIELLNQEIMRLTGKLTGGSHLLAQPRCIP